MRFRCFSVPLHASEDQAADLNQFLAAHRIVAIDRQFVGDGANGVWATCVSFDETGSHPAARATAAGVLREISERRFRRGRSPQPRGGRRAGRAARRRPERAPAC